MTARVHHAELWGTRKDKYDWLTSHDVSDTRWATVQPRPPFYLFNPQDTKRLDEYNNGFKITDGMPVNSVGIVTARDELTIQDTPEQVWKTVRDFAALPEETAREKYCLGKDARDWQVQLAQRDLKESGPSKNRIVPVLYRPFHRRFTYYTARSRGFICMPRPEVMRHMLAGENLGLICTRQTREKWDVLPTRAICGHKSCSAYDINSLFPLYVYPSSEAGADKLFAEGPGPGKGGRRANLSPGFVAEFGEKLGLAFVPDGVGDLKKTFGPEDVFHYAYAVFHSPTYRSRYAEFLKIDFPRLPLTGDRKLFRRLCALGAELVGLHLLERVPEPKATYPQSGDSVVDKPRYKPPTDEANGRVYVNKDQYFNNIPPEVWEFHVGGYQVCEKWLKDRKGRTLSYDDIQTYRKITEALRGTIRLMGEIDAAIPAWPLG